MNKSITLVFQSFTLVSYFLNMFSTTFTAWTATITKTDMITLSLSFNTPLESHDIDTIWKQAAASGVTTVVIDNGSAT